MGDIPTYYQGAPEAFVGEVLGLALGIRTPM